MTYGIPKDEKIAVTYVEDGVGRYITTRDISGMYTLYQISGQTLKRIAKHRNPLELEKKMEKRTRETEQCVITEI